MSMNFERMLPAPQEVREQYPLSDELAALVETAGGEPVAMIMQNRATPDPRSFIGDGKEFAKEVEFFSWEKLDEVDHLKQEFGL